MHRASGMTKHQARDPAEFRLEISVASRFISCFLFLFSSYEQRKNQRSCKSVPTSSL